MTAREHIATSLSIEPEDFDYAPFSQRGGLGKAHQLIGDKLLPLLSQILEAGRSRAAWARSIWLTKRKSRHCLGNLRSEQIVQTPSALSAAPKAVKRAM